MERYIYKFIIPVFFLIYSVSGISQTQTAESWELDSLETGNKTYIAKEIITLKPGFKYTATSGNTFIAKIDQTLLFPPTGNTYADANGNIVNSSSLGAVVGSIPGQFDVSPTGAATYTVPIEVPSGIQGMQPNISLVYNSQSGNGIAGWGWSLSGTSAITKGAKTIFSDDAVSGINLSTKSDYYLDGNKLLGKTGFTYCATNAEYETENKTYVQIKQTATYSGTLLGIIQISYPSVFTVTDKNGTVMEYGQVVKPKNSTFPFLWLLSKVTDANGNFVKYIYKTNTNSTQTVIDYIEYGSNGSTAAPLKVVFNYETKNCIQKQWMSGCYFEDYYLLTDIIIKSSGIQLRNYHISYDYRDEKHFMADISLTGENNDRLNPVKIVWGADNKAIAVNSTPLYNPSFNFSKITNRAFSSDDIDGDGISDLIEFFHREESTGEFSDYLKTYKMKLENGNLVRESILLDLKLGVVFNFDDVIRDINSFYVANFNGSRKKTILVPRYIDGNGINYFSIRDVKGGAPIVDTLKLSTKRPAIAVGDINNDGIDEIIYVEKMETKLLFGGAINMNNGKIIYIKKNNLTEENLTYQDNAILVPLNFNGWIDTGITSPWYIHSEIKDIFLVDLNADGLKDLMIVTKDRSFFMRNDGGVKGADGIVRVSFTQLDTYNTSIKLEDNESAIKTGDFNGDGLMDFILYGGSQNFDLCINNGNFDFSIFQLPDVTLVEDKGISDNDNKDDFIVTDFNHDGKSDLIIIDAKYSNKKYSSTDIKWYASNGYGTFSQTKPTSIVYNDKYYLKGYATSGDFDGDGREDLFSFGSNLYSGNQTSDNGYFYRSFNTNFEANQVKSVTDGFGNKIEIAYQPLTFSKKTDGTDFYTQANSTYPVADMQIPLYCVNKATSPSGNNTLFEANYSYSEAKVHLQGKGFLGFAGKTVNDSRSKTKSVSNLVLDQNYYLPQKETQTVTTLDNNTISIAETYFTNSKSGKIYTSFPDSVYKKDYLTTLSETSKYYYDSSTGNLTKQRSISGNLTATQDIVYDKYGTWAWVKNKPHKVTDTQTYNGETMSRSKYFYYNDKGNLTLQTKDSTDVNKVQTFYSDYDVYGNPGKITTTANGVSRSQSMTYSNGRFLKKKTDNQFNETVTYNYDEPRGLLKSKVDRLGTTSYEYDNFGRLKQTTYPDGLKTANALQWAGTTSGKPKNAKYYSYSETSLQSPVWVWYDALGREIRKDSYGLNNKKIMVDTEYNNNGQLSQVSEPYFSGSTKTWAAIYTYDRYGRDSTVVTPMGTTAYAYSELSTTVTSPSGTRKTTVNTAGRVDREETNGKYVEFTHNASGLVKTSKPQDGPPISLEYDLQGNRIKITDPDAGVITSKYDGWGQLLREEQKVHIGANSTVTTYNYLPSGLLNYQLCNVERTDYSYDSKYRLKWVSIAGKHSQGFVYDSYDRIIQSNDTVDGSKVFVRKIEYDQYGRVSKETYPGGYEITNKYDKYSYLTGITDKNNTGIWQAMESNARGQLTKTKSGSKETVFGFNNKGLPTSIATSGITKWSYVFDSKANLVSRTDGIANYKDSLVYDPMNRLTSWNVYQGSVLQKANSIAYNDTTGLIDRKNDLNNYIMGYGGNGKPHALTSVSGMSAAEQTITYTDFKKVKQITEGGNVLNISYGTDEQRVKTVLSGSSGTLTRYYMGDYEEEIINGNIRKIHYIRGSNGLAAIYVQNAGKDTLYYAHTDYQGSLTALSLPDGTVKERYAYDPWGNRRNPTDWTQADSRTGWIINRGYTMHEHLPEFSLINMNGRVYDPLTSMFLSPDPYMQVPGDWLNYNRYAYAMNNPFMYTDPSGELFYIDLGIGWNMNGGFSFSLGVGVGFRGKLSAGVSIGYELGNNSWSFNGTASYAGVYHSAGYNTSAGWTTGTGYGQSLQVGIFSVSIFSAGVSYNQYGGFSTNVGWANYSQHGGFSMNPSISVSYTADTGNYGTYNVEAKNDNSGKPIPYNNETAELFMEKNSLERTGFDNLYADGTLAPENYRDSKTGKIYYYDRDGKIRFTDGAVRLGIKKYIFWGKQPHNLYLYTNAFSSPEYLHIVIGHELVHVELNNLGLDIADRQEINAYTYSYEQAQFWGLPYAKQYLDLKNDYIKQGFLPYEYHRPIRTSKPVWP